MAILYDQEHSFKERVKNSIADDFKHNAIKTAQDLFYGKRAIQVDAVDAWQDFRKQAAEIRDHVLANLDYYLNKFADNAEKNGAKVYFAKTDKDACGHVVDIFKRRQAKSVVKAKTMVSEEIDVNHALMDEGIEVNETDLAEVILQLDNWNPPSHIVVPALHLDRTVIQQIFSRYGYTGSEEPAEMTRFARQYIRKKFLNADVGITGCNFGVADTGSTFIVTNEGNGRMVTTLPEIQIVLMGMERLVPDLDALSLMMELLIRSSVGSKITSYFSMTNGPRKPGEMDGPKELHLVIIDNGRSEILRSEFRSMLRCIRCGACLNICPVYRHITGHAYGSIYPGPMGAVLTPLLVGYEKAKDLPYASTLCGACTDHCPVKIPLHELLLKHRENIADRDAMTPKIEKTIFGMAGMGLSRPNLYNMGTKAAARAMKQMAGKDDMIKNARHMPILKNWVQCRDMPLMKKEKFRDWFKTYQNEK
ncbi:MAG: iron-sulfur cluster-binding protein [Desulfobacter postgatei]|uniref:Iron-sulfur cluster-binding protein n=1 Tax=Desulfobacter postgatei TaxID=2293 RepID=A0A2G6MRM0_9BACT|nr:MAG: iron-sulfur cluster-binding protein [Desulfobacter postgatei]